MRRLMSGAYDGSIDNEIMKYDHVYSLLHRFVP